MNPWARRPIFPLQARFRNLLKKSHSPGGARAATQPAQLHPHRGGPVNFSRYTVGEVARASVAGVSDGAGRRSLRQPTPKSVSRTNAVSEATPASKVTSVVRGLG
jgi:hypothetical protein